MQCRQVRGQNLRTYDPERHRDATLSIVKSCQASSQILPFFFSPLLALTTALLGRQVGFN